ncbi:alpha/beta hydrolase [Nocardia sp. NPDC052566]|uniref:alpha/beta hydrolase n=1 Tax=Nocardia sp. NPDC052566 TaxID=3364330 RepID=UPI0037CAAEA8
MSDLEQHASAERPAVTKWWVRPVRWVLLAVALVLGVYIVLGQLLAIVPVSWTSPLLHKASMQSALLQFDWVRDVLGSWNLVLAAIATAAALAAVRLRRTRVARTTTAFTGAGFAVSLITATILVFSVHSATGSWFLFAPTTLGAVGDAPDATVTYAVLDGRDMKADIYYPTNTTSAPAPLVVMIHGGGFVAGNRGTNPYTSWLAEQGYAVFDVDYRLASDTEHRWDTEDADVGCAMTWANAHAKQYNWDPDRVATIGGSAGGGLSVTTAYKINNHALKPSCGTAAELPRVKTVVGIYPAVDLTASEGDTGIGAILGRQYVGGPPAEFPDRYRAVDSANQISADSPPTLLVTGGRDHLVFASNTERFARKLADAGVVHRYVELPFYDHGYDGSRLTTGAKAGRALILSWLREHL